MRYLEQRIFCSSGSDTTCMIHGMEEQRLLGPLCLGYVVCQYQSWPCCWHLLAASPSLSPKMVSGRMWVVHPVQNRAGASIWQAMALLVMLPEELPPQEHHLLRWAAPAQMHLQHPHRGNQRLGVALAQEVSQKIDWANLNFTSCLLVGLVTLVKTNTQNWFSMRFSLSVPFAFSIRLLDLCSGSRGSCPQFSIAGPWTGPPIFVIWQPIDSSLPSVCHDKSSFHQEQKERWGGGGGHRPRVHWDSEGAHQCAWQGQGPRRFFHIRLGQ